MNCSYEQTDVIFFKNASERKQVRSRKEKGEKKRGDRGPEDGRVLRVASAYRTLYFHVLKFSRERKRP